MTDETSTPRMRFPRMERYTLPVMLYLQEILSQTGIITVKLISRYLKPFVRLTVYFAGMLTSVDGR
jgi:hypothetical protein